MLVDIFDVLKPRVLLTCQSDQPILVQEDRHRVDHTGEQHIDPEVILVLLPSRWVFQVLLDDKRTSVVLGFLLVGVLCGLAVSVGCVIRLVLL